MVADIRAEFDAILDEIDWMDPSTRTKAKAKGRWGYSRPCESDALYNLMLWIYRVRQ